MKALVLGGNGFIGSHLVDKLIVEGHFVRVFDIYEERYRKPLAGVEYCTGDFGNRGLLADALVGIDTVFHLISTTVPKTSNDDPAFDVSSNIVETIFLLEQCVAKKIGKIIFVSSGGTVYGNPATLPIVEDCATEPLCSYGITKLTIEKYLALFHSLYGLDYVVVRPSNPYGERQNPFGIQGAVTVFLGKVAAGKSIEIWGDGEIVRDYIYVGDLVVGIYQAGVHALPSRIYNLASGVGYSLNDIVRFIRNITGEPVRVNYREKRAFDVSQVFLDITRAKTEWGWQPLTLVEDGIKRTWEFVRQVVV